VEVRRTVQFTGGSSYTVTLPKEWVERMGLKKGSVVILKTLEDGSLVISPESSIRIGESQVEINLDENVGQLIVGAYLYGYSLIRVKSAYEINDAQLGEIKRVVRGLVGAEIVDETPYKVEIQVILDEKQVAPEKILRRQHNLVMGMVENAVESFIKKNSSLAKLVIQRDEEVDRLYFTLVRIIRSAVIDPALAKQLNTTPLMLLDLRVAAKFLEDAGDQAAEIAKEAVKTHRELIEEDLKELQTLLSIILSMGTGPIDALTSQDMEKILQITGLRERFLKSAENSLKRLSYAVNATSIFKVYSHLAKICEDLADIAELGLPFKVV